MLIGINEKEEVCANCTHYCQHYVRAPFWQHGQYGPCDCGHCTYPRMKIRKTGDTCEKFEFKTEEQRKYW